MLPHHYTKRGSLCGRITTLRREVCMAALLHYEGRFVWPHHYTERGDFYGSIITLREEVCVYITNLAPLLSFRYLYSTRKVSVDMHVCMCVKCIEFASCSTSGTSRISLVKNLVSRHEYERAGL